MRRSIAAVGAVVLGLVTLTPGVSPAAPHQTDPGLSPADQASVDAGLPVAGKAKPGAKPAGANPFLALLRDRVHFDVDRPNPPETLVVPLRVSLQEVLIRKLKLSS